METKEPIVIIAFGGRLAWECIEQARAENRLASVIAVDGESIAEVTAVADAVLKWGQVGQLIKALEASGARKVLLIGSLSKRPDFLSVINDFETIKWLPKLLTTLVGGDDSVLRKVIEFFESTGYQIISVADVAPALLAPAGVLTRKKPTEANRKDILMGLDLLDSIAPFDVGQAVVVGDGRVAAIEGAEGTDAMIERVREIRQKRRVAWKGSKGVLVKATKTDQDLRVDLPVIGPETVQYCADAQLAGIAVEAGRVVIASQQECLKRADQLGIFVLSQARNRNAQGNGDV